ncbi:MAG: hypothetical protein ABIY70_08955 [Capsulimonas sp.]|uniref:hypothetical protein n=1 Tax=Capsulimonas sp. TaxID=2494211 RepID=UPI00326716A3
MSSATLEATEKAGVTDTAGGVMDANEIAEKYTITAAPVDAVNGQIPQKFIDLLKKAKADDEMRVFTVGFKPAVEDENAPRRRATDMTATALVVVEFGEAKILSWNKPTLEMSEHEDAFAEAALRAVARAGDD